MYLRPQQLVPNADPPLSLITVTCTQIAHDHNTTTHSTIILYPSPAQCDPLRVVSPEISAHSTGPINNIIPWRINIPTDILGLYFKLEIGWSSETSRKDPERIYSLPLKLKRWSSVNFPLISNWFADKFIFANALFLSLIYTQTTTSWYHRVGIHLQWNLHSFPMQINNHYQHQWFQLLLSSSSLCHRQQM